MEVNDQLLDVLKDIRDYFSMQDAEQIKAKIDKPPKIAETQKEMRGGATPVGFKPGTGIAKQMPIDDEEAGTSESEISGTAIEPKEETELKAEDVVPEEEEEFTREKDEEIAEDVEEEIPVEDEDKEEESNMEIKSLLKDIKSLLQKNTVLEKDVTELKKSVDSKIKKGIDAGMRKLGFANTKPAIQRLGLDDIGSIKKSVDESKKNTEDMDKVVGDLSKESWATLGALREKTGDLNAFPMYKPSGGK